MIVVLGGGFAGLSALSQFPSALVLDRKDYFTLTPWIIDYACGSVSEDYVIRRYNAVRINWVKPDFKDKVILTDKGKFNYDKLLICLGHKQNLPRVKGAKEYALKIETFEDAKKVREEVAKVKDVVVIGGGATGVELAGNLKLNRGVNVTLVQRRNRLLPTMTTSSSEKAKKVLEEVGVNVMLETEAQEVKARSVVTNRGEVPSELTIFAGGLKGPEIIDEFGHPNKNHRMIVDKELRSIDHKDVYGAGDCATFEDSEVPMSADVAINMGKTAMKNALGDSVKFEPKRIATILRIGNEYFGDLGDSYVEGGLAKVLKGLAYVHSRALIAPTTIM